MKSLWPLIKPYRFLIAGIVLLALSQNALYLVLPKIVSTSIDAYIHGTFHAGKTTLFFLIALAVMFICLYAQNIVQAIVSERLARDMRKKVLTKISNQRFSFVQTQTSGKLLTNLSSDVDGIKAVTGQIIPVAISSFFLIGGSAVLLFTIDWRLTLVVLAILPILGVVFGVVFSKVGGLFKGAQEVIDRLNRVINESILGAALIRVVHSQHVEYQKFIGANEKAKSFGISILKVFASMIPIIMFISNIALVVVLVLGGHFVINGTMTIGDLVAFNSYIAILIFPIMMLGFLGSAIARAKASNDRIQEVLNAPEPEEAGLQHNTVEGSINVEHITLTYGEKKTLSDVSFNITPRSRTAIIGPTAAGKTQLLFAMSGLISPTSGSISYDSVAISQYDPKSFYKQVAIVFQDSVMFRVSLRENIMFGASGDEAQLAKAIETAELSEVIANLPEGLDTVVSERGTSLSGGQKQRIMLARALVMNPKVLLLDDFTARVDVSTEQKILKNLAKNYPDITLVSVTQKITTADQYDQVLVLMEGEIVAFGTHADLLHTSPEYAQIWESQQSIDTYQEKL